MRFTPILYINTVIQSRDSIEIPSKSKVTRHHADPPIMQTIGDITGSFHLYAVCVTCSRMEQLPTARLIRDLGAETELADIRRRIRCNDCGARTTDIRIVYVGPDRSAAGFHYR